MSGKVDLRCKYAIIINGKHETGYIWDKVYDDREKEVVGCIGNRFTVFDKETGERIFSASTKRFLLDPEKGYIWIILYNNKTGLFSYRGEEIVPIEFDDVKPTAFGNVWKVTGEKNGYWLSDAKQFIKAGSFEKTRSGNFEFYVDGKWTLYTLNNGKYVSLEEILKEV